MITIIGYDAAAVGCSGRSERRMIDRAERDFFAGGKGREEGAIIEAKRAKKVRSERDPVRDLVRGNALVMAIGRSDYGVGASKSQVTLRSASQLSMKI